MNRLTKIIYIFLMLAITNQVSAMFNPSKWPVEAKLGLGITISSLMSYLLIKPSVSQWFSGSSINYPEQYSINLMWINKQVSHDQEYIYPSDNKNNFGKKFLDIIFTWAKENSESTINVWFDSLLTTEKTVENTQVCINQEIEKYEGNIAKIELKDIRNLKTVKKNPEIFSSEMPVYFRSDLLRAIVAEESTRQNTNLYFVYADFDVKPMTKAQLFDKKTLEHLNNYNFVMAHEANRLGFENSFQIFTYNEKLSKATRLMVIEANILRARKFLKDSEEKSRPESIFSNPNVWNVHGVGFQENVFYSYPLMYTYFCQLQNLCTLTLPDSDNPYDKDVDGKEVLNMWAKSLMIRSSATSHISKFPIPTKKVSLPPSTSADSELYKSAKRS